MRIPDLVHLVSSESRHITLNIEQMLMLRMAPDYHMLPCVNKVEVFEYALENTTGQDLAKVLWLKSQSAEVSGVCV